MLDASYILEVAATGSHQILPSINRSILEVKSYMGIINVHDSVVAYQSRCPDGEGDPVMQHPTFSAPHTSSRADQV